MGSLHSFEDRALATLRARLGAAEEANEDLIAFARGHRGAVVTIHQAVLEAMQSPDLQAMVAVVVGQWPDILGIDQAALALPDVTAATLSTNDENVPINSAILKRAMRGLGPVTVRNVVRGHPLFGRPCVNVRAEALIRIDCGAACLGGLLLLGQTHSPGLDEFGGSELLQFLGASLGAMIQRWRTSATG